MVCIVDRLQKTLNRKISSEQIWKHLKTMYNLKALDDLEPLPFPNNEENFDLPFLSVELQTKLKNRSESEGDQESDSRKMTIVASAASTPSQKSNNANKTATPATERNDRKSHNKQSETERIQPKRTRGSIHHELNVDGTNSPPPQQTQKRRRI